MDVSLVVWFGSFIWPVIINSQLFRDLGTTAARVNSQAADTILFLYIQRRNDSLTGAIYPIS
jgi:hypothetical protein